jgi:hypothetical protein
MGCYDVARSIRQATSQGAVSLKSSQETRVQMRWLTWRAVSARPSQWVARAGEEDGAPGPAGKEDESAPSQVTQIYSALSGTTTKTSDKPGESPEEVEGAQLTAILTGLVSVVIAVLYLGAVQVMAGLVAVCS